MNEEIDEVLMLNELKEKYGNTIKQDYIETWCKEHDTEISKATNGINRLLTNRHITIFKAKNDNIVYKIVEGAVTNTTGLTPDALLVLQLITQVANQGIWMRDIRTKSGFQAKQVDKVLKTLESRKLIKSVRAITGKKQKVYMLFGLEPSREITGGLWYTDEQEFDRKYFETMYDSIFKYIQESPGPGCTIQYLLSKIVEDKISKHTMKKEDVSQIVDILIFDGKIEDQLIQSQALGDSYVYYELKANAKFNTFSEIPCGHCPHIKMCGPGNAINPLMCKYLEKYLQY